MAIKKEVFKKARARETITLCVYEGRGKEGVRGRRGVTRALTRTTLGLRTWSDLRALGMSRISSWVYQLSRFIFVVFIRLKTHGAVIWIGLL